MVEPIYDKNGNKLPKYVTIDIWCIALHEAAIKLGVDYVNGSRISEFVGIPRSTVGLITERACTKIRQSGNYYD